LRNALEITKAHCWACLWGFSRWNQTMRTLI
jgi:hypothetical protein